jgi:hypothetical protein
MQTRPTAGRFIEGRPAAVIRHEGFSNATGRASKTDKRRLLALESDGERMETVERSVETLLTKANPLALIRLLGAAATTQDEQLIRRAARMEEDRKIACAELRANMLRSEAYTKMSLAEAKKVGAKIANSLAKLQDDMNDSRQETNEFLELRRNQSALEVLDAHKPFWNKAIHDWLSSAHGIDPNVDSDNPDTITLAKLTADFLALGEKEATTHTTAIILYHPRSPITESIKVAYATEGECNGFKTGQTLRRHAKVLTPIQEAVWSVIETGHPMLCNPYNHPEVATSAISIAPLTSTSGHRFGAIVSGAPALPDEFLGSFAATAGQMFERIGKLEFVWRLVGLVQTFVEKQCLSVNKLVYVDFVKDAVPTLPRNEWDWQPLEHTHPYNDKKFELPLTWKGGEPIGLFTLECATFTEMDEQLIVLTHTVADMLLEAVIAVEQMELGTEPPLCSPTVISKEYERRRSGIAEVLSGELSRCIKVSLTFFNSVTEAGSYCNKVDDEDTKKVMQGVLTLAGYNCKGWDAVRKELKKPRSLVEEIANVSMLQDSIAKGSATVSVIPIGGSKSQKQAASKKPGRKNASRWNLAEAYLKGVDIVRLAKKSPVPIRLIIRWLLAAQKVYNIGVAMASRTEEAINPLVQKMFETIDTDLSGTVSVDELVTMLVNQHGAASAMRFLRVIDVNDDGSVSQDEWHAAWRNGQFDVEESQSDTMGPPGSGLRLLSRHLSTSKVSTADSNPESSTSNKKKLKPIKKGTAKGGNRERVVPLQ